MGALCTAIGIREHLNLFAQDGDPFQRVGDGGNAKPPRRAIENCRPFLFLFLMKNIEGVWTIIFRVISGYESWEP